MIAVRHVPFEPLGRIAVELDRAGIWWGYADLYECRSSRPDMAAVDGLVVMGGPMSANDPLQYLEVELSLISEALAREIPVLGVCLGAQLVAKALGAAIRPNLDKEIGWRPLDFTPEAASDPLFAGLEPQYVFHWHGETFDLPSGAVHLARSAACENQAFRWGDRVWGLQFHLEVTPEIIESWLREDAMLGPEAREVYDSIDPYAHEDVNERSAREIFGRWLGLVLRVRNRKEFRKKICNR